MEKGFHGLAAMTMPAPPQRSASREPAAARCLEATRRRATASRLFRLAHADVGDALEIVRTGSPSMPLTFIPGRRSSHHPFKYSRSLCQWGSNVPPSSFTIVEEHKIGPTTMCTFLLAFWLWDRMLVAFSCTQPHDSPVDRVPP